MGSGAGFGATAGPDDRHAGAVVLPAPLRPLTVGDIIDGAFQVLKRAPGAVLAISAVFVLPVQILAAWLQRDSVSDLDTFFGDASAQLDSSSTLDGAELGLSLLVLALSAVAPAGVGACLARLVTGWYAGRDQSAGEVFRSLVPVLPSLVGAFLITHLLIGVGLVACVIPGAVVMVFFVVTMPIVAVERVGPVAAIQRSVTLVSKRFWPALGVVALSVVGSIVLETSLSFIPTIVAFFVPESIAWAVLALGAVLAAMIVTPVVASATVLLYLDLRFRVEGLDLQLRSTDVLGAPRR
jgi:hypothetical protein